MRLFLIPLALCLLSCASHPPPSVAATPARPYGWRAPAISLLNQDGVAVNMASATSGKYAAVFFYPEADTPG